MVACGVCGKRNIAPTTWFWFKDQAPIHPWCEPMWDRLKPEAKRKIERLAAMCQHDPAGAQVFALVEGQVESR